MEDSREHLEHEPVASSHTLTVHLPNSQAVGHVPTRTHDERGHAPARIAWSLGPGRRVQLQVTASRTASGRERSSGATST